MRSRSPGPYRTGGSHPNVGCYTLGVDFVWDERKNESNIRRHGLDFVDADRIFAAPMLVARDEREEYGEDRWIGIGRLDGRVVVVVFVFVFVFSEPDERTVRIISLRKALRDERAGFEQHLENQLGAG